MHLSRKRLVVLAVALAGGMACGDHLLDVDDGEHEPETLPVCMVLSGTLGYWDDGDSRTVYDPELDHVPSVCMCMTQAQFDSHELHGELNDAMLVECERLSALLAFDSDECEADHASESWLGTTYRATPDSYWHFLVPSNLDCE